MKSKLFTLFRLFYMELHADMTTLAERQELEHLMMGDKAMEERVRSVVRQVLQQGRKMSSQNIRGQLGGDPRQSYRAVRSSVYRRILGGQINILSPRRAGTPHPAPPAPSRQGQRGGNRLPRSRRTQDLLSYWGADRGFVLRFINSGIQSPRHSRYGNRGTIEARNFFSSSVDMDGVAEQLAKLIDDIIQSNTNG